MAGSIPPLVSSSPPPLNAFDDDEEEEEEDEFGGYAVAEDLDYNECISFKDSVGEKQNEIKNKKEQDSTSQDSTTDSGLCPDSEGVSPTPHSDEEKQKQADDTTLTTTGSILNGHLDTSFAHFSSTNYHISNGFGESSEDHLNLKFTSSPNPQSGSQEITESSDNLGVDSDFGNFEFASTSSLRSTQEIEIESIDKASSPESNDVEESIVSGGVENGDQHKDSGSDEEVNTDESFKFVAATIEDEDLPFESNPVVTKEISTEDITLTINGDSEHSNSPPNEEAIPESRLEDANFQSADPTFDDDEFDDFTDFKANFPNNEVAESEHSEFSEHSKSSSGHVKLPGDDAARPVQHQIPDDASDDEFSNFADFSSSDCAFVSAQSSNSAENSSYIPYIKPSDDSDVRTDCDFQEWVSVFPSSEVSSSGLLSSQVLLREDDAVWLRLVPPQSSPALNYSWSESLSNRSLLQALSIDSRNILWGVPRFAANLSCGVLQPVKAVEPLQPLQPTAAAPVPAPQPPVLTLPTTNAQETVPDAHFDWGSSGLTNPLDCPRPPPVLNLPKALSPEAEGFLRSLRDLSYMRKTYIVFPMKEGQ